MANRWNISHPIAAFFFISFRLGALLTYLLGSIFTDNFTFVFVITILLLAFDFWTVKNISGRLLVGLRWWNEIQPDGSNKWVFESASVSCGGLRGTRGTRVLMAHHTNSPAESIMQQTHACSGGRSMVHLLCGRCLPFHVSLRSSFRGWLSWV